MSMDEFIIIVINTYIEKRKKCGNAYDAGYLDCARDVLRNLGVNIEDLDR